MQLEDDQDDENLTCIKPEITRFPDPLINKKARQHGAVLLHILLAVYVFIGKFFHVGQCYAMETDCHCYICLINACTLSRVLFMTFNYG